MKKHRSYRGTAGKIAPISLNRNCHADNINEKWVTDFTEIHLFGKNVIYRLF